MNRKRLFIFIFLTLFVFMNNVNASDYICEAQDNEYDPGRMTLTIYEEHEDAPNTMYYEVIPRVYEEALEMFQNNYGWSSYFVSLQVYGDFANDLQATSFTFTFFSSPTGAYSDGSTDALGLLWYKKSISYTYELIDGVYTFTSTGGAPNYSGSSYNQKNYYQITGSTCKANPLLLFAGNADLNMFNPNLSGDVLVPVYGAQYTHASLGLGNFAPYLTETLFPEIYSFSYTELSLDVAPYLILSLPSYDVEPFETKIFAKGQFCFTPVYNYGTEEKANPSTNGCYSYDDYTAITISISQEDLDNHAIYYVSSYDGSTESSIKINPNHFNYKYIYNTNNPSFTFDGTTYNIIPYDNLTTSAKTNTTNGVIPGASCQLGDLACTAENDPNVSGFDNLIDNILDFGSSIWSSVVNFMTLVTKLITVLPPDFQQVILICFTFGLIIGCVKIFIR